MRMTAKRASEFFQEIAERLGEDHELVMDFWTVETVCYEVVDMVNSEDLEGYTTEQIEEVKADAPAILDELEEHYSYETGLGGASDIRKAIRKYLGE